MNYVRRTRRFTGLTRNRAKPLFSVSNRRNKLSPREPTKAISSWKISFRDIHRSLRPKVIFLWWARIWCHACYSLANYSFIGHWLLKRFIVLSSLIAFITLIKLLKWFCPEYGAMTSPNWQKRQTQVCFASSLFFKAKISMVWAILLRLEYTAKIH